MDRNEQRARPLSVADDDLHDAGAVFRRDPGQAAVDQPCLAGVLWMDLDEGLGQMRAELRAPAGARHGVPLVAEAAGIEPEREFALRSSPAMPGAPAR